MEEAGRTTVPSKQSRNLKAVLCVPLRVKVGGGSEIEFRKVHSFAAPRVGIVAVPIQNVTGGSSIPWRYVQLYRVFAVTVPSFHHYVVQLGPDVQPLVG